MWPFHVCILGAFPPLVEQWRHQNGGRGSNAVAARPRAEESGGRCQTAHASERTGRWCTPEAPSFLLKACRGKSVSPRHPRRDYLARRTVVGDAPDVPSSPGGGRALTVVLAARGRPTSARPSRSSVREFAASVSALLPEVSVRGVGETSSLRAAVRAAPGCARGGRWCPADTAPARASGPLDKALSHPGGGSWEKVGHEFADSISHLVYQTVGLHFHLPVAMTGRLKNQENPSRLIKNRKGQIISLPVLASTRLW